MYTMTQKKTNRFIVVCKLYDLSFVFFQVFTNILRISMYFHLFLLGKKNSICKLLHLWLEGDHKTCFFGE